LLVSIALVAWPLDHARADLLKITAVTLQEVAGEAQVSIVTTGPARYQQRNMLPQRVAVDVQGAELGIQAGTLPQSGGVVSKIRVGQFASDVVRVVVEVTRQVHVRVVPSSSGIAIIIGGQTTGAGSSAGSSRGGIAKVTRIALWGTPTRPWVSVTASAPVRYQLRNFGPNQVVVDVSKAQLALADDSLLAGRGFVKQIRASQFALDTVRVAVELLQHIPVHIATSPDRTAIVVSFARAAKGHQESTETLGAGVRPTPSQHLAAATQPAAGNPPAPSPHPPAAAQAALRPQPETGSLLATSHPPESAAHSAATPPTVPQDSDRSSSGSYLLGPEDVLEITVWGYPDMTRVVTVRPDGQVAVPLAGTVPAAGRSVERLTQDLGRAIAKYIINPQVTVIVKEFRKIRISVLGQANHPGTYTLPPGARVLDALSAAGGITDNAALSQAQIIRASGERQPLSLDSLIVQQDVRQNVLLQAGDTLMVPEDTKNRIYVLGDVNRPGVYPLKGDVTVLQALATAGGPVLHGTSSSTTAHIVRRVDPSESPLTAGIGRTDVQSIANGKGLLISMDLKKMYQGDLRQDQVLRPGDVMVVPAPGAAALPTILSILSTIFWGLHL
jgi:polysaccharide biosynthesis/export protein